MEEPSLLAQAYPASDVQESSPKVFAFGDFLCSFLKLSFIFVMMCSENN